MGVTPCFTVNVEGARVVGSMGLLNVAATVVLTVTPVALAVGVVELTVGAVVSTAVPVVKLQT